jgi:hypothetical protein
MPKMTYIKYLLAIVVAAGWYAMPFLSYSLPIHAVWPAVIFFACWIPLLFFSLSALFRRNWKAVAVFSATWVLALLPLLEVEPVVRFRFWLYVQGFRIHTSPLEDYLSGCRLTEFVEQGTKQTVGECELDGDAVYDDFVYVVFYDTTGEIALPLSQRTPEWMDAMYHYSPKKVLRESQDRAEHLNGSFYRIRIDHDEFDGDTVY